jgi:hypothetical protein
MKVKMNRYLLLFNLIWPLASCPTAGPDQVKRQDANLSLTVSQDVYEKTFDEIRQLLKKIDALIATRDFEAWKVNCTAEYLSLYSDPARLRELSQKPYLKDHNIVLKSLEDYFMHVFIPSRLETKLDKIDFIEIDRVKAVTVVAGVPYVVYFLEKDKNNQWKIGVW